MSTISLKDIIQAVEQSAEWALCDDDMYEIKYKRVIGVDAFISALEKLEKESV